MAVIYIIFAFFTAILFVLTRDVFLTIEKQDFRIIKIDLTLFSVILYDNKKYQTKSKAESTKGYDIQFIYKQIKNLLASSEVQISRLYLPLLPCAESPGFIPFSFGNSILGSALAAFIKSIAKKVSISDGALLPDPDSSTVYHIMLKAPLYRILYAVSAIRLSKLKKQGGLKWQKQK